MRIGCLIKIEYSNKENGLPLEPDELAKGGATLMVDYLSIESIHPAWMDGKPIRFRSFIKLNCSIMGKTELMVYGEPNDLIGEINKQVSLFELQLMGLNQKLNK